MRTYITKEKFKKLTPGNDIEVRFIGPATVVSNPFVRDGRDTEGADLTFESISVKFRNKPWNDKVYEIVRQQIKAVK